MRFMVIKKAGRDCEAGKMPSKEELAAMGRYNEELAKAGVFLALEGLAPSSKGARVRFDGKKRIVTDGPFTESKELVGGFWMLKCDSLEEAVGWAKRVPFEDAEVEIRQVIEPEDFGEALPPELREMLEARR